LQLLTFAYEAGERRTQFGKAVKPGSTTHLPSMFLCCFLKLSLFIFEEPRFRGGARPPILHIKKTPGVFAGTYPPPKNDKIPSPLRGFIITNQGNTKDQITPKRKKKERKKKKKRKNKK
jgi:hypothetical protein